MTLMQDLSTKALELRKARDPLAIFISTVVSKVNQLAKADSPLKPEITDDHVLRAINSFIKAADDVMEVLKDNPTSAAFVKAVEEKKLLKSFLPAAVSTEEVVKAIEDFIKADDGKTEKKKLFGPIMASLNSKFGASLNKKEASELVKNILS